MEFSQLNLNKFLLQALEEQGIKETTPIQAESFSTIMSGRDVIGVAQTGTGKTLAYLLPILRLWQFAKDANPRILILVPTRELTIQVKTEIDKLSTYMNVVTVAAYGGVNIKPQIIEVTSGCDIIVATPGRMLDLLWKKTFNAKMIKQLVIDEVDEMFVLGFRTQLENILDLLPEKRQNLLFSATISPEVERIIDIHFKQPERIYVAESATPLDNIVQGKISVPNFYTKVNLLSHLFYNLKGLEKCIVFVNSKKMADKLYENLDLDIQKATGVLHANKSQNVRLETLEKLETGKITLLIATDVLARGIDLNKVTDVINFEVPDEPASYIHRIGRTGRAEHQGRTISFVTKSDEDNLTLIQALMDYTIPKVDLPEEVEISEVLLPEEIEVVKMPNLELKNPRKVTAGGTAFHEKSKKNVHISVEAARKIKRKALKDRRAKAKIKRKK